MKFTLSVIVIAMLALSFNAQAAMWTLVNSEFVQGGWMCTYRLDNYTSTIYSKTFCQSYIFN